MAILKLKIVNAEGIALCEVEGNDFVDVVYTEEYAEGNKILLSSSVTPVFLSIQLDDAIGKSSIYLTDDLEYEIPFGENRANMSPKAFKGDMHYLFAEVVTDI